MTSVTIKKPEFQQKPEDSHLWSLTAIYNEWIIVISIIHIRSVQPTALMEPAALSGSSSFCGLQIQTQTSFYGV